MLLIGFVLGAICGFCLTAILVIGRDSDGHFR